jgi:hypothetical protein
MSVEKGIEDQTFANGLGFISIMDHWFVAAEESKFSLLLN